MNLLTWSYYEKLERKLNILKLVNFLYNFKII